MDLTKGAMVFVESGRGIFGMQPLKSARSLGLTTVLVARDISVYNVTPEDHERFAELVDETMSVDTRIPDLVVDAVVSLANETNVVGVFSAIDYFVPTAARAAAALNLPGLSPEAAKAARDKRLTRSICRDHGIPAPISEFVHEDAALERAINVIGYPIIIKPATEAAGIGVRLCHDKDQAISHFRHLTEATVDFRGQAKQPGVLVEEYLVGLEVSVESVDTPQGRETIGVTDKGSTGTPYFVEDGETFPSTLSQAVTAACVDVAHRALDAINFNFGASHVELKVTRQGPKVVEINPRMAGGAIGTLIELATGIALQLELTKMHCGLRADFNPIRSSAAASRYIVPVESGAFHSFDGLDLAQKYPGFVEFQPYVAQGALVGDVRDNRSELGYLVFEAATSAEAERQARAAASEISVRLDSART